jgi:hypothetical protein
MHQKLFLIVTVFSVTSLLSVDFHTLSAKDKEKIVTGTAPLIVKNRKRNSQDYLTPPIEIGGVRIQTEKP